MHHVRLILVIESEPVLGPTVAPGTYTCLKPNATQISATPWQYWEDDGVDSKVDGWYDYDNSAAAVVEQLYAELQTNPGPIQQVVSSGA